MISREKQGNVGGRPALPATAHKYMRVGTHVCMFFVPFQQVLQS